MEASQGGSDFCDADYMGRSVVVKDHKAGDETQLDLKVGDVVYVLEQDETGWWGGHKEGEENTGWFPGSNLKCPLEPVGPVSVQAAVNPEADASQVGAGSAHRPGAGRAAAAQGPEASPVAARRDYQAESVKGSPESQAARTPGGCCASPASCDESKFMRDSRMVASPQRAEIRTVIPGTPSQIEGSAAVAAVLAADGQAGIVDAEKSQLQAEVSRLLAEMSQLRRQSSADQNRIRELEQELKDQELQLKSHASAQGSLSSEATVLRDKLQREQQNAQAQKMANDQMRQRYEEKLKEKAEENMRDKETARREIKNEQQRALGEQQRAREIEEQLRKAQEELQMARREQQELQMAKREPQAPVASANSAKPAPADKDVSRRLFVDGPSDRPQRPAPAATDPALCGRLPKPMELRSPQHGAPHPRPWLGHARSTDNLLSVEEATHDPPRGFVGDKISMFEERCRSQTPSRQREAQGHSGRSSEPRSNRQEQQYVSRSPSARSPSTQQRGAPPVPRSASRGPGQRTGVAPAVTSIPTSAYVPSQPAPCRSRGLQLEHCPSEDEGGEGQLFMGMSPIHKAASAAPMLPAQGVQLPPGAMAVPATWDPGAGLTPSPDSSPQVPVSERIQRFQIRTR